MRAVQAPYQNMAGVAKKRAWGRSRPTAQGVTLLDNIEVEELINTTVCEEISNMHATVDLQHPEMATNDDLVEALVQMKVPIPRYDNGEPSRERLIYLFKTHITPRPQRNRHGAAKKRKCAADCQIDPSSCDWESSDLEFKSRKRKLDDADVVVPAETPSPPSGIFMAADHQPVHTLPSTKVIPRRVVKLKLSEHAAIAEDLNQKPVSPQVDPLTCRLEPCTAAEGTRGAKEQFRKQAITWP